MTYSVWGSFGSNVATRDVFATETFATLRALTPPLSTLNVTINVDGGTTKGDGFGGIFYFDSNSVLTDDSVNVIAPTTGTGRWIRRDIVPGYNNFRKNAIINGGMEITQRAINFPAAANGYILDRYNYQKNGTMVHTISQDNDVPTIAQAGQLFLNSLRLNLTTSQAVIGVNDYLIIQQHIEGYNWRALAQRPCTLSFWVKATLPGIYCINLRSSTSDACFIGEYTIFSSNTWEKKIIPIAASPVTGTWNYTTGLGLITAFTLAAGLNRQQAIGWGIINNAYGSNNQINGVAAGATDFRITGVQLEAGNIASEFERRTIQEELILCQRYYEKSYDQGTFPGAVIGNGAFLFTGNGVNQRNYVIVPFKVRKRIVPVTVNFYSTNGAVGKYRQVIAAVDGTTLVAASGEASVIMQTNDIAPLNDQCQFHWTADAEF